MTNVSRNSLDLIETAGKSLKGKFGKAFLATLILVAPIMACIFSVYLIPVAVLLYGVLQTGYIRYMRALLDGQQTSYKMIFSEFTNPGLEILLGTMMVCMFVLGGVLVVIPGIVLVGFYSMALYFAEKNKSVTPIEALKQSRQHMRKNITNLFAYKVLYWLGYVVLIIIAMAGGIASLKLWGEYTAASVIIFLVDFVVVTLLWALISTYYNATTELFFRELLVYSGETKEEAKEVVAPVEEKVEEVEEKPVKKQTTKKTTVAKAVPAKKTGTKTTAAAKATTKPATKATTAKTSKSAEKPVETTVSKKTKAPAKKTTATTKPAVKSTSKPASAKPATTKAAATKKPVAKTSTAKKTTK